MSAPNQNKGEVIKTADRVDANKYYAIETLTEKGFITMTGYRKGFFIGVCGNGMTYGNGWDAVVSSSIFGCLHQCLSRNMKVTEFTDCRDLFNYLATAP